MKKNKIKIFQIPVIYNRAQRLRALGNLSRPTDDLMNSFNKIDEVKFTIGMLQIHSHSVQGPPQQGPLCF